MMNKYEFRAWLETAYKPSEVVNMLIRFGILEYEDIIEELGEFVDELQDYVMDDTVEWGDDD